MDYESTPEHILKAAQRVIDLRALEMAQQALSRISSHEEVCAERMKNIGTQLGQASEKLEIINKLGTRIGASTIFLLLMIIAYFLNRFGLPGH